MAAANQPAAVGAVFVMGLPRSGSTLLSRLLNTSPDILSVNDLYFLQQVIAQGALYDAVTDSTATQLTDCLLEVINTRSRASDTFIGQFHLEAERIRAIRQTVLDRHRGEPMTWYQLMDELLGAVARAAGKSRWADKTPQNFHHFKLLSERFPDARFVFLFRDPRRILASYKYARGEGHDMRRYHPLVYALYWRSAVRLYAQVAGHPRVTLVKYEQLLEDSAGVCSELGKFLGTSISVSDLASLGANSSFSQGGRKSITSTEAWICQRICNQEMARLGYTQDRCTLRLADLPELAGISMRFAAFQAARMVNDRDARSRAAAFIRSV